MSKMDLPLGPGGGGGGGGAFSTGGRGGGGGRGGSVGTDGGSGGGGAVVGTYVFAPQFWGCVVGGGGLFMFGCLWLAMAACRACC